MTATAIEPHRDAQEVYNVSDRYASDVGLRTGLHTNGRVRTGHTVAAHDAGHGAALGYVAHVAHDLHFRQGQEGLLRAVDAGCAGCINGATT